jgi:hypothetical protein
VADAVSEDDPETGRAEEHGKEEEAKREAAE